MQSKIEGTIPSRYLDLLRLHGNVWFGRNHSDISSNCQGLHQKLNCNTQQRQRKSINECHIPPLMGLDYETCFCYGPSMYDCLFSRPSCHRVLTSVIWVKNRANSKCVNQFAVRTNAWLWTFNSSFIFTESCKLHKGPTCMWLIFFRVCISYST